MGHLEMTEHTERYATLRRIRDFWNQRDGGLWLFIGASCTLVVTGIVAVIVRTAHLQDELLTVGLYLSEISAAAWVSIAFWGGLAICLGRYAYTRLILRDSDPKYINGANIAIVTVIAVAAGLALAAFGNPDVIDGILRPAFYLFDIVWDHPGSCLGGTAFVVGVGFILYWSHRAIKAAAAKVNAHIQSVRDHREMEAEGNEFAASTTPFTLDAAPALHAEYMKYQEEIA
jgi:hypothetical protein